MNAGARLLIGASLALAAPAGAQSLPAGAYAVERPGQIERPGDAQDIGFRIDRDERMTIAVRIDGKGPFRFLVDTGATRTVVSSSLAAALGLEAGPVARLHSTTGTALVRTAVVPRLELGPGGGRRVVAALLDAAHMGADGIIGVDSLRSEKLLFDLRARRISIVPGRQRVRDEQGTIVVRGKLRQGHLIVTNATANRVPLAAVLDTGSEITMGNAALRGALEARGRLGPAERISLRSVTGGILVGDAFRLDALTIGDAELRDLVILFAPSPIFRRLGLDERPALLLGMNALGAFDTVAIDFARKRLRMTLPGTRP
jgi:predicted aspartyl protease